MFSDNGAGEELFTAVNSFPTWTDLPTGVPVSLTGGASRDGRVDNVTIKPKPTDLCNG